MKISLEEFLVHPVPSLFQVLECCGVAAWPRQRVTPSSPYCDAHRKSSATKLPGTFDGDEELWRLTALPVHMGREVGSRGLPRRLVAELLYCVQQRTANDVRTIGHYLRTICDRLRFLRRETLEDLGDPEAAGLKGHAHRGCGARRFGRVIGKTCGSAGGISVAKPAPRVER